MHQGRGGRVCRAGALVVLGQGEAGAGDRFPDPQAGGDALHQRGLAGPQVAIQQQDRLRLLLLRQPAAGQLLPERCGGARISQEHAVGIHPGRLPGREPEASASLQNFPSLSLQAVSTRLV